MSACAATAKIINWVVCKMFTSHSSESWKSKIRAAGWVTSGENPPTACRLPTYCCSLTWLRAERRNKLSCDSYKGTNCIHEDSTLMTSTSCNPIYLSKSLPPNTIPLWRQSFNIQFLRGHKCSVHDRTQPRIPAANNLPVTFNNHNSKDSACLLLKEENEQERKDEGSDAS